MNTTVGNFEKLFPRKVGGVRERRRYISLTPILTGRAYARPNVVGGGGKPSINRDVFDPQRLEPLVSRWSRAFQVRWVIVLLTLTGFSYEQASQLIAGVAILFSSLSGMPARWDAWWREPSGQ